MNSDMILASGSMVVRKKPGKGNEKDLLGSQSLRKVGSEIAILQHNGEKMNKKLHKKHQKIIKINEEIENKEQEIDKLKNKALKNESKKLSTVELFHGTTNRKDSDEVNDPYAKYKDKSNKILAREIKNLENNLENLVNKYNSSVAENKSIREKIDALRKEKNFSWMKIYKKLEKELAEK